MDPIEYVFPDDLAATGYCAFPNDLEQDDLVLFHATPIANFDSISKEGFKIPDPTGVNGLPSVSFAKQSSAALNLPWACEPKIPARTVSSRCAISRSNGWV